MTGNSANPRSILALVPSPFTGRALDAPPVLIASTHTTDFVCGKCATVLMHAEEGQVHSLYIHCMTCGSYNATAA